jgi:hypothetical protein
VTPGVWLLLAGALLLFLLAWTVWTLTRLSRLEARVARAWTALDTQLQRRAGLAEELARGYPAAVGEGRAAYLATFVADARGPGDGDREQAENVLGRELRELRADLSGVPTALLTDLDGTTTRLGLARRFYNDAVRDTRALRRHRLPRLLRLHASRPLPRYFDIDDRLDDLTGRSDDAGQQRR